MCAQLVAAPGWSPAADSSCFLENSRAAAVGTIPAPNPTCGSIRVQETAGEQRETSLLSWEEHGVCFGTGCRPWRQEMPRWAGAQGRHLDSMFCISSTVWVGKLTDLLITQCNGNNISEITVSFPPLLVLSQYLNSSAIGFSKFLMLPLGHKSCYIKEYFWHKYVISMITSLIQARFSLADHFSTVPNTVFPVTPQWFEIHPLSSQREYERFL